MLFDWNIEWPLDLDVCPCDQHFLDWLEEKNFNDKVIFHMGTGAHHLIGKTLAKSDKNFLVHAITAAPSEHKEYVNALINDPQIGFSYKPFMGDIYQLDPRQYHSLDIVNLFHLCEFSNEICKYGPGLTDIEVVKLLLNSMNDSGFILTYMNSFGFEKAKVIFETLANDGIIKHYEDYKTLKVWTKL